MAAMFLTDLSSPIFWACFAVVWILFAFHEYLSWREYKVKKDNTVVPAKLQSIYTQEEFDKSRRYSLDKARFGFLQSAISIVESSALLLIGALPFTWLLSGQISRAIFGSYHGEILQSLTFILVMSIYQTITTTPFSYYDTFYIEARHGMNKQTLGFWIKDKTKGFILGLVIGLPIAAALLKIIQIGGNYVFLYAWLLIIGFSLFMLTIYQDFIAPIFDKFMNLPPGTLRERIEKMANELGFPLHRLYIVEGSKRSLHSNAYFMGLFWRKSIVLYDTLLEHSPFAAVKEKDAVVDDNKLITDADAAAVDAAKITSIAATKENSVDDEINDDYDVVAKKDADAMIDSSGGSCPAPLLTPASPGVQTRAMAAKAARTSTPSSTSSPTTAFHGKQQQRSPELEAVAQSESEQERLTKTEDDRKLNNATKCNEDEVMGILCHEFGHWVYGHTLKNLAISWTTTLIDLYVFGLLYQRSDIYQAFGFADKPIIMGLIIIFTFIFSPVHELLGVAMTYLSRRHEFQADAFAIARNYGDHLKTSLQKLSVGNLSFPLHDKLYSALNHSHPTLLERIDFIDAKKQKTQ